MNQRLAEQLEKILALADSNHEGEALGALRMARRLLERGGMSFADLAAAAKHRTGFSFARTFFSGAQVELEAKIEQLQDDLIAHMEQNESLSTQIEFWRRRAFELEQVSNLHQAEALRWKQMARETAERLWDVGQMAHAEAALGAVVEETSDPDESGQEVVPEVMKQAS